MFDIQTPVAIAFGVRTGSPRSACKVRYQRVSGSRQEKFEQLDALSLGDVRTVIPGAALERFAPYSGHAVYWSWPKVTDIFPWYHSGAQFHRTWPIGETKRLLQRRWDELVTAVPRSRAELFFEKEMKVTSTPTPLLSRGKRLRPISLLDRDDQPESIQRYAYRSFDRQWAIADKRLADRPRPILWRVRGKNQLFLTTPTSSKLGHGPLITAALYIPDGNHFHARRTMVMPIYRNPGSQEPNVPVGLLEALSQVVERHLTVEDLVAYIYALLGTSAFSERFAATLAEMVGAVHIPITSNPDLLDRAMELGRELLWYHTWGERFRPAGSTTFPQGNTTELSPISGYPDSFLYRPGEKIIQVGTGRFGPIEEDVWNFRVSGLQILDSWLGYRMEKRKGKPSGPLSNLRPRTWVFTDELLRLITILQRTIDLTPTAAEILDDVIAGPLIPTTELPQPTPAERKAPRT